MDFFSAVKLAQANEHLIGKDANKGVIEEIIIMPTDEEERIRFIGLFKRYMDAQRAIESFMNSDVEVFALFEKKLMRSPGAFVFCSLYDLPEEVGAVTEI